MQDKQHKFCVSKTFELCLVTTPRVSPQSLAGKSTHLCWDNSPPGSSQILPSQARFCQILPTVRLDIARYCPSLPSLSWWLPPPPQAVAAPQKIPGESISTRWLLFSLSRIIFVNIINIIKITFEIIVNILTVSPVNAERSVTFPPVV